MPNYLACKLPEIPNGSTSITDTYTLLLGFVWVLGIQTHVARLVLQIAYPLSLLLSPWTALCIKGCMDAQWLILLLFLCAQISHNIQPTLPSCPSTLCEHRSFNVSGNSHSSMWQLLSHLICGALLGFIAIKDYLFGMSGVWPEMDESYFRIFFFSLWPLLKSEMIG